ncbi:MAG: hypothetical protein WA705_06745 [Candidatus Ozemobacteraceae bacterium]
MGSYFYKAFGLTIESEIDMERLSQADAKCAPGVSVLWGDVPESISTPNINQPQFQANAGEMLLRVKGVANFYVCDGKRIVISPCGSRDAPLLRIYLLGSCFGALLQQRGTLALHGSCVSKNGRSMLLTGASGAGKSTLATTFLAHGWKLLSDDVTPVYLRGETCYACPSYPSQKLWEDALSHHDAERRSFGVAWEEKGRAKHTLDASEYFSAEEAELDAVCVLSLIKGERVKIVSIDRFTKVDWLMKNTYRADMIAGIQGKQAQFRNCVNIGKRVRMLHIGRPEGMRTESEIALRVFELLWKENRK